MKDVIAIGMLLVLAGGIFTGFPVALVLAGTGFLAGFVGFLFGAVEPADLGLIYYRVYGNLTDDEDVLFVSVPLLILLGTLLHESGLAGAMFRTLGRLLGRVPGSMPIAALVMGLLLAPAAGVIGASVVTVAMVALGPMLEAGYPARVAGGAVAAAGALGVVFPPAIMLFFIAYTMHLEFGLIYLGMLTPVLLLAVLFAVYFAVVGTRTKGPATGSASDGGLLSLVAPAVVITAMLWSVISGAASLSEASGVGVAAALVLAAANRRLSLDVVHRAIMKTGSMTAMVFFIFVGATVFSLAFRLVDGHDMIAAWLNGLHLGRWTMLALLLGVVLLLGFVFDWIEILVVFLPILQPLLDRLDFADHVGSPYLASGWRGALVALALQTSFLTPPFGYALFFAKASAPPSVRLSDIYRGAIPLVAIEVALLIVLALFPDLVTWLPVHALHLAGPRPASFTE